MVNLICPGIYTDNLGCDKAKVYFLENGFYLNVRGCKFHSEYFDFEFCAQNSNKVKKFFYLENNELMEYILDIRIPLTLKYKKVNRVEKFILRIERQKSYYNNSLLLSSRGKLYEVQGHDFQQLLVNMKKELSKENILKLNNSCIIGI